MPENNIPLQVPDLGTLEGSHPIVILGPNGAGKTQLGAYLARAHEGRWISALRSSQIPNSIGLLAAPEAELHVKSKLQQSLNELWEPRQEETAFLLIKLKADDAQAAVEFRDKCFTNPGLIPPKTNLVKLAEFWAEHFPGRSLDLSTYTPLTRSALDPHSPYAASRMSDGERVAVYLAMSILEVRRGIIVIDEPELHLHSALSRQLWDAFEDMRPDCRFVYITHDVHFALSRRSAQFLVVRGGKPPELILHSVEIPEDILEDILGGITLSMAARRVVFCEGKLDHALYGAWFNDKDTTVVSVGSCSRVEQCVEVFNTGRVVKGGEAIGIIDRDYFPEAYFSALPAGVYPLKVHEIENLFCLPAVFGAVGKHLQIPDQEISTRYERFLESARTVFRGGGLYRQILERAKRFAEIQNRRLLNAVASHADLSVVKANFIGAFNPENWGYNAAAVFEEEERTVRNAVNGPADEFLRVLPGKDYLNIAAGELGMLPGRYIDLVISSLKHRGEPNSSKAQLHDELESAFADYLPSREQPIENPSSAEKPTPGMAASAVPGEAAQPS